MNSPAVVIANGLVVTSDGPVRADIVIRDGRIAALTADASDIQGAERIDAEGLVVVPGGVDVHTHFREPDIVRNVEGFATGTSAAVAGGITSAVEMPQGEPIGSTGEVIRQKKQFIADHSRIDIALWGGVVGQPIDDIQDMIDEGVVSLKAFMAGSSPSYPHIDDAMLLEVFEHLAGVPDDIPFGLHAESDALLTAGIRKLQDLGRNDPLAHAESRPPLVETEAVHRAIFFAERTGGHLYICHCASAEALDLVAFAKASGVNVHVETCPQYLLLDTTDLEAQGPWARCAPAMRERDEVEAIWTFIEDGTIDVISSDHAAYTIEEKEAGLENIWEAPLGCSGVQTMYPGVIDEMVNQRGYSLERFVELSATNPARLFSLYPRKGTIQVGSDADLVLYDLNRAWTVHGKDMLHKNKWTPFEGKSIGASVVQTLVRGVTKYRSDASGVFLGDAGHGQFLPRGYGANTQ